MRLLGTQPPPDTPECFPVVVVLQVNKCRPQDSANAATQVLMKRMHPGNSTWPLDTIVEVWPRRYRLQRCALELMFRDGHSAMFSLISRAVCDEALKVLQKHARNLRAKHSPHPEMDLKSSGLTEKWQRREISNFEYLMHLNTYAGRTYNDLSQYPVFPWVLRDYTSDTLDLGDERVYRDLRQPIGVLGPAERQTHVVDRYETLRQADMEPFHFGSHYSSLGVVLYYLIRLEPFTSLAVLLQGGKFDHADRLFDGLEHCWTGCLEVAHCCSPSVLLPEAFGREGVASGNPCPRPLPVSHRMASEDPLEARLLAQALRAAPLFWGHSRSIPQGMISDPL